MGLKGFFRKTTAMEHSDGNLCNYNFACFLYEGETWSLTLREEHKLWVIYNKISMKIFGPNWNRLTGGWRKLNFQNFFFFCSSPNIIWAIQSRGLIWVENVTLTGAQNNCLQSFIRETWSKKITFKTHACKWEDNIKSFPKETGREWWD